MDTLFLSSLIILNNSSLINPLHGDRRFCLFFSGIIHTSPTINPQSESKEYKTLIDDTDIQKRVLSYGVL